MGVDVGEVGEGIRKGMISRGEINGWLGCTGNLRGSGCLFYPPFFFERRMMGLMDGWMGRWVGKANTGAPSLTLYTLFFFFGNTYL